MENSLFNYYNLFYKFIFNYKNKIIYLIKYIINIHYNY